MTNSRKLCECGCGQATEISKITRSERGEIAGQPKRFLHRHSFCQTGKHNPSYKHGCSKTTEFYSWKAMIQRCYTTTSKDYPEWGGRGIIVCERWLGEHGFENFLQDMGKKPNSDFTIGRKDDAKIYSLETCEWQSTLQQNREKRDTKLNLKKVKEIHTLSATGLYTQKELAKQFLCSQGSISNAINNKTWVK